MKVPFLDLASQYASIKAEIDPAIQEVIDSSAFAGGKFVEWFENEFSAFCGSRYCAGVGNGTDALWLALLALGIGRGDEVITTPLTFYATIEAIVYAGARPVFVDIDEDTYTMDPALIEAAITGKTKAIMPVHLFGQTAEMDLILDIAKSKGLYVIEDACQAHGATYKGKKAGSLGEIGCFSFYPGKNLGAFGEAGAVVTDNGDVADKIRMLRDHGQPKKYRHDLMGWNARMDGIQGAVLSVKLKHLDDWNEARRENAVRYDKLLSAATGIKTPRIGPNSKPIYHIYAVRVERRDEIIAALSERDIHCGIHYPIPVHRQEASRIHGIEADGLPISETCAGGLLSLPMHEHLTLEMTEYVAENLIDLV